VRRLGFVLLLLVCAAWDPVTSKNRDVEEGNRRFGAGEYEEAERRYRRAQQRLGGEPGLHFDLGAVLHKQAEALPAGEARDGLLDAAERELRLALDASDPRLRSSAHYNLGNTLFRRGKLPDAIEEYKKSLKLDPTRDDARHNLELALRLKEEPPPEQQPQPSPDGQPQDQPQSQDPQAPQEPQQPEPQPQEPPQQGDEPQPQPQPQPQEPAPQPAGEGREPPTDLSGEAVERKLDALEEASRDQRARQARERGAERRRGRPVKDW
jgi:Ca-activated chloride channel homolog